MDDLAFEIDVLPLQVLDFLLTDAKRQHKLKEFAAFRGDLACLIDQLPCLFPGWLLADGLSALQWLELGGWVLQQPANFHRVLKGAPESLKHHVVYTRGG